ncbi:BTAD domain-containing putative transcriptional regulator [Paenibacillus sp. 2003]|uniref:bacterial transcriptional activator domain-containing protein n=1 Tax=Paenibacillus TaxID=44249 RepID=UPI0028605F00|nr:BTAD domain-containing putative transcriptional regulator [Paenibacillus sp. 2003]MDR6718428.1 tetratricopeptide (TPR) repeat protein [Paenibacillus sp. 2003]
MKLENVILDVAEWNSSPDVKDISEDNLETYLKKINSYTGDYLQEYDYWWAEGERQRLKQLWLNTALCVGQWYEDQQKFSEALTTYLQINRLNPAEENSSFSLMKLYDKMGEPIKAFECYQKLVAVLEEEYDMPPGVIFNNGLGVLIYLAALIGMRLLWYTEYSPPSQPHAVQGELDLSSWQFDDRQTITLNGSGTFTQISFFLPVYPLVTGLVLQIQQRFPVLLMIRALKKKTKYTWWGNYGILHSTELSTYEKLKKHL